MMNVDVMTAKTSNSDTRMMILYLKAEPQNVDQSLHIRITNDVFCCCCCCSEALLFPQYKLMRSEILLQQEAVQ